MHFDVSQFIFNDFYHGTLFQIQEKGIWIVHYLVISPGKNSISHFYHGVFLFSRYVSWCPFKTTEAYNACNKKGGKCLQFHEGNSNVVLQVFQNIWNVI